MDASLMDVSRQGDLMTFSKPVAECLDVMLGADCDHQSQTSHLLSPRLLGN